MSALENVEGRLGVSPNQAGEDSEEEACEVPPSSYGISRMGLIPPVDSEQGVATEPHVKEQKPSMPDFNVHNSDRPVNYVHQWKGVACAKKTFKIPPILNQRLKEYCRRKGCYEYEVIDSLLHDFFRSVDRAKERDSQTKASVDSAEFTEKKQCGEHDSRSSEQRKYEKPSRPPGFLRKLFSRLSTR